ncbi:MAG: lactate utilization protein [Bacteroidales bacterium]|nr:lactate utilization protein [Bacteroidales bacterium]
MGPQEKKFKIQSEKVGFDLKHRSTIQHNIGKYYKAVEKGKSYFSDLQEAKNKASSIKDYVINHLDELLLRFEKNALANNMEVLWAAKKEDVIRQVIAITEKHKVKSVVKMKSMVSEELELNEVLEKHNIKSLETDLGEFIVQLAGEKPYHILTPAMHKSKDDIAKLFNEKFGTNREASVDEITKYVRNYLREQFVQADLGITGANFLVADSGSIALTENEGNGLMTVSWPETMVVIAGFEKIIPGLSDLDLFWPLLSVNGTGQYLTAYNSIISGTRADDETDGPKNMYVILFDGGRSNAYEQEEHHLALKCIRCGACLNYCPVYQNIGGYTYDTVYSGPIGSVLSMYLDDSKDKGYLNFASSLCGKCTEVCPVEIPLHRLLLLNRKKLVEEGNSGFIEKEGYKYFGKYMASRKKLEKIKAKWKNRAMKTIGKKAWGSRRAPLSFAPESFAKRYMKKH